MGREAGDIALNTSIAVGAVTAVIKEIPTDFEYLFHKMAEARQNGKLQLHHHHLRGDGSGVQRAALQDDRRENGD